MRNVSLVVSQGKKCEAVLQKSTPAQIRQLILYIGNDKKDKLMDLCGNWLLQNEFLNTFCDIRPV